MAHIDCIQSLVIVFWSDSGMEFFTGPLYYNVSYDYDGLMHSEISKSTVCAMGTLRLY